MKLIICVDRDNDVGERVGVRTPVIGRDACLEVATQLGLSDPEDSDVNAIFEGVRLYDELKAEGEAVELVLLAGDRSIGRKSDEKISRELDEVLTAVDASSAVFVSDGAEDEWLLPIIQSRVKVDFIKRVVVKQSQNLESTFYIVKRVFEDPKFARSMVLPLSLIFFALSISILIGRTELAAGIILLLLGIYLLFKGLGLENVLEDFSKTLRQSFYGGKITFVTYVGAIILAIVGMTQGVASCVEYYRDAPAGEFEFLVMLMLFIKISVWWYVAAALSSGVGRIINAYIEGSGLRHLEVMFFVISAGLMLWGGSECVILLNAGSVVSGVQVLLFSIFGGVVISLIGIWTSAYMKLRTKVEVKGEEG
ncbi:DUF373 family protein [Candidatus Alkanophaga liquidiphilum]